MSKKKSDEILGGEGEEDSEMEVEKSDYNKISNMDIKHFYPWITNDSKCNSTKGMLKLHYEILDFYDFIKLNKEETEEREETFNYIKNLIESQFNNYEVKLYGSFKTGLSLPNSDIDVLIMPKEEKKHNKNEENDSESKDNFFDKIREIFKKDKKFTYIEILKQAKVPIMKCEFEWERKDQKKKAKIQVDINLFAKDGLDAIAIIEKTLTQFPELRPFLLLIKYFLRQRNLNEIYKGGVSSFIIFTLVYYYIICQVRKERINRKDNKNSIITLGHLLVGFLNFYGFNFNYDDLGISIRYGGFLYKKNKENNNFLSVENFQDSSQDIGKSCFKFKKVVECFKLARDQLYYPVETPVVSYLQGIILPDEILKARAKKYYAK